MEHTLVNQSEWSKVAEVELVYKTNVKASERPKIVTSKDCYDILKRVWNPDKIEMLEEFKVLLLNRANRVIGVFEASMGGITGTVADPRLILAAAIKSLAVSVATYHPAEPMKT
jgi:DNA repair protein RadC